MAEIGGPPTLGFNRCDRYIRPCTDPLILGETQHFNRTVEIIGHGSDIGLCLWFDFLGSRSSSASGSCGGGSPLPPNGEAIWSGGYGVESGRKRKFTQVDATLRPDVATVDIAYRRGGDERLRSAYVTQVDGDLLTAIGESEPFGIAELTVRGCISGRSFKMTALDSKGEIIGTAERFPRFFNFCSERWFRAGGYRARGAPDTKTYSRRAQSTGSVSAR